MAIRTQWLFCWENRTKSNVIVHKGVWSGVKGVISRLLYSKRNKIKHQVKMWVTRK